MCHMGWFGSLGFSEQRFQVVESFIAHANLHDITYSRDCDFTIQRDRVVLAGGVHSQSTRAM